MLLLDFIQKREILLIPERRLSKYQKKVKSFFQRKNTDLHISFFRESNKLVLGIKYANHLETVVKMIVVQVFPDVLLKQIR
jgi:hypothetical protein